MQASQIAVTAQWAGAGECQIKFAIFATKYFNNIFGNLQSKNNNKGNYLSLKLEEFKKSYFRKYFKSIKNLQKLYYFSLG